MTSTNHTFPHQTPDKGWGGDRSRGAALGRLGSDVQGLDATQQLHLAKVRLNTGGYDSGGAYWGAGEALWCVMDHNGDCAHFRASTRDLAKEHVRSGFDQPDLVRFYR